MRGHVSDCVCCTQGNFALRGEFLSARAERNQRAAKGWAQDGRSAPIFAHPLDPRCGGYPLNIAQPFRRAKSEWQSKFPPGHFVVADFVSLASPGPGKARSLHRSISAPRAALRAVALRNARLRASVLSNANPLRWALRWGPPSAACWTENFEWCGSKTAPGFDEPTLPARSRRRGGLWPPAGRSGTGPYEGVKPFSSFAVGAGPRPARSSLPPERGKVSGRRPDG